MQSKVLKTYLKPGQKELIASYKVAQLLVKRKKSHMDAESIIAPALHICVEALMRYEAAEKMKKIPFSNNTISCRIEDISEDLQDKLCEHFNKCNNNISSLLPFQIDESFDICGKAQLLDFVQIVKDENLFNEFLFGKDLKETTKGQDIFDLIDKNLPIFNYHWKNCVSICIDGGRQ